MSSYINATVIFIPSDSNEAPPIMNPSDISLIDSIIRHDMNSFINEFINRIDEENKPKISKETFNNLKTNTEIIECPICFKETCDNKELQCEHVFCNSCIKRWLTEKCNTCPVCRKEV
tara:strand:+ start:3154 stop:3507 length:354 start_codon:yes stop_codon:yes gene_type:complete